MTDPKKSTQQLITELQNLRRQLQEAKKHLADAVSKQRDNPAKQREKEYQAVIQAAFDGFWICNLKGEILDANDTFCQMLGYTRQKLLNMNISDIEASERPEDTARHIKQIVETGNDRFDTRHRRSDGTIIDVAVSAVFLPEDNGKIYVFTTRITERKKVLEALKASEQKYRHLVDDISDGIFQTDGTGHITFANKSLAKIHGVTTPEELIGTSILDLVRDDYKEKTRDVFFRGVQFGEFEKNFQVPVYNAQKNRYIFVSVNASLADSSTGTTIHGAIRDISEIKDAEEQLKKSELRFRTLINASSQIVWMTAGDGTVNQFQKGWADFTGQGFEEMKGMGWLSAIHPDDMEKTQQKWAAAVENKTFYEIDHRLRKSDGTFRHFNVKGVPLIDDQGHIIEWIGTHTDVTEQKKIERQLRVSEENHRAIFESAMDAMIVADIEGNIVDVNPAACAIYGYDHHEFIGINASQLIHPDHADKLSDFIQSLKTVGHYKGSTVDLRKDGTCFDTDVCGSTITYNNQPHLLAIVRDMTEQKRAQTLIKEREQRLERAIRHAPLPVMIHAEGGEVLQISDAWTRITGYTLSDIPTINAWCEKAYQSKKEDVTEIIRHLYQIESYSNEGEFTIFCKNGRQVVWEFGSARIGSLSDGRKLVVSMAMDVTERNRVNAQILQEKQFVSSVINSMPGTFYLFSHTGEMIMWNDMFETISGYATHEIKTMSPLDFFDPRDHQSVADVITTALEGQTVHLEADFIAKTGEVHPYYFTGKKVELNHVPHVLGVGVDISERRRAEQERAQALAELTERMKEMTCLYQINELVKENSPSDTVGSTLSKIARILPKGFQFPEHTAAEIQVDGRSYLSSGYSPSVCQMLEPVLIDGRERGVITIHVSGIEPASGETVFLEEEQTLLTAVADSIASFIRRFEYERALIASEEKFRTIIQKSPLPKAISNSDNHIELVNESFLNLIGYDLDEIPTLEDWFCKAYPDDTYRMKIQSEWAREMAVASEKNQPSTPVEATVRCKDGKDRIFSVIGNHIGDKTIVIFNDLTDRIKAETRLRSAVEELKRSNEELEQFAYVASHDLQEPLRMISSYTQLLEKRYKDQLDDKANTFIHYAVDGAKRMQQLINDLLSYSRVSTRGGRFETVDCNGLVDRVLHTLAETIQDTRARITCGKLPEITGDASQLGRLFQNLIANAIKFCKDRAPVIHIDAETRDRQWIFCVQDNGIGIDPKFDERIFVIFQRLHGRGEFPGTGIGLAICKRIVQRHGGKMWVKSEPGKGSVFYFSIPQQ